MHHESVDTYPWNNGIAARARMQLDVVSIWKRSDFRPFWELRLPSVHRHETYIGHVEGSKFSKGSKCKQTLHRARFFEKFFENRMLPKFGRSDLKWVVGHKILHTQGYARWVIRSCARLHRRNNRKKKLQTKNLDDFLHNCKIFCPRGQILYN